MGHHCSVQVGCMTTVDRSDMIASRMAWLRCFACDPRSSPQQLLDFSVDWN